jgi:polygalacturonase
MMRYFTLRTGSLIAVCILLAFSLAQAEPVGASINVLDYGAKGDGEHLNSIAIQKAIDVCAKAGGGTVYLPNGVFLTGTLYMKNNVTLHLAQGCTLLGSTNLEDYPVTVQKFRSFTDTYTVRSMIYAEDVERIAITGRGTIDGNGFKFKRGDRYKNRPYIIRMVTSRHILIRDITLKDSAMWVQHYLACDDVRITGITVRSRYANGNNDGIDIDSCQRVIISDCNIDSLDDAIVLKSTSHRPCKDVVVENCILSTRCNALKLGTESIGGFENIKFTGCAIYNTRLSGIAIEVVDGGTLENVVVSDITMDGVGAPIFIRCGARNRPFIKGEELTTKSILRNITISNIQAKNTDMIGCPISGLPDQLIENLTLSNIRITFVGGGKSTDTHREIEEKAKRYPEHPMFGKLPAYGFYVRHARNVKMSNVHVDYASPEERPGLVCDDVEGLDLLGFQAESSVVDEPLIILRNTRNALIHGCRANKGVQSYLRLEGEKTDSIMLTGNDLRKAKKAVDRSKEVKKSAVVIN